MKTSENRYIDALIKLILFSAVFHIILITIYSIVNLDITYLNYFNILDIDLFFPGIIDGSLSQVFSILMITIIYLIIYSVFTKKDK